MSRHNQAPAPKPVTLTIQQTRTTYNISPRKLYKLIAEGRLRSTKLDDRRLIFTESIEALLAAGE